MGNIRLFHVSENPGIKEFVPQPIPSDACGVTGAAVWAVDEIHLPNYLLPRDCPRVTFRLGKATTPADREKFFSASAATHVIAVESGWMPAIRTTSLYVYEFPPEGFEQIDAAAGYYISRTTTAAISVTHINDSVAALLERKVELRVLPSLWPVRDAVIASTLQFSIIRLRNAQPRPIENAALKLPLSGL